MTGISEAVEDSKLGCSSQGIHAVDIIQEGVQENVQRGADIRINEVDNEVDGFEEVHLDLTGEDENEDEEVGNLINSAAGGNSRYICISELLNAGDVTEQKVIITPADAINLGPSDTSSIISDASILDSPNNSPRFAHHNDIFNSTLTLQDLISDHDPSWESQISRASPMDVVDLDLTTWDFIVIQLSKKILKFATNLIGLIDQFRIRIHDNIFTLRVVWFIIVHAVCTHASLANLIFHFTNLYDRGVQFLSSVFNIHVLKQTPHNLKDFQKSIPSVEHLPKSLGLVLSLSSHALPYPPEIPQPYLDGNRNIQAPNKYQIQKVFAIRQEYIAHTSSHYAAEKLRLVNEISRFVMWGSLISMERINIYERFGILWSSNVEQELTLISDAIYMELNIFICNSSKLGEFNIPKIILVDGFTGTSVVVNDPDIEILEVELIISSYGERKELHIYLSDHRLKEVAYKNAPTSSNLIVVPKSNYVKHSKSLDGYRSFNIESADSLIYFGDRFGYDLFVRSLYFFAIYRESLKISKRGGAN